MKRLLDHMSILEYVSKLSPSEQKKFAESAGKELLNCFSEISLNLAEKNIKLSPLQVRKLRKHEKDIIHLSRKNNSLKKRRNILTKGTFLKNFLGELVPTLINLVITKNRHGPPRGEVEEIRDEEDVYGE